MIEAKALVRKGDGSLQEFEMIDPTQLDKFIKELPEGWHAVKINLVARKGKQIN